MTLLQILDTLLHITAALALLLLLLSLCIPEDEDY